MRFVRKSVSGLFWIGVVDVLTFWADTSWSIARRVHGWVEEIDGVDGM